MENRWNDIIKSLFGRDVRIVYPKFFYSKKNQVTLLYLESAGKQFCVVAKYFVWGDPEKEKYILEKAALEGVRVPAVTASYENILFIEYIPGTTIKSILANGGFFPAETTAQWLGQFHRALKTENGAFLKGDAMPPNFIIHKESELVYGIDFEESAPGHIEEDIADITATIRLIGGGSETDRAGMTARFLQSYLKENPVEINYNRLIEYTIEAFERRYRYLPELTDRISEYKAIIKKEGKDFFHRF
ncbi:MAG: hypothetical protein LWY06_00310 [Firmicutes bacterium]|nr:hypothetical protein [Bacillota bacterium]